jgi:hypothetical protein
MKNRYWSILFTAAGIIGLAAFMGQVMLGKYFFEALLSAVSLIAGLLVLTVD